jgi:cysteine desulfurase
MHRPRLAYLDHAATTPVRAAVVEAMAQAQGMLGNPSSLHDSGRRVRRAVEEARESIAQDLGVRPSDVVLTASGTEADNLAIKGMFWARTADAPGRRRILASAVEHHAVLDPVVWLAERQGAEITWLPVDEDGRVRLDAAREAVARDPASVAVLTVMWANNEVGTIQPVPELAALAAEHGIPFHVDAVQAVGQLPVAPLLEHAGAAAISGHKLGGPVGSGALVIPAQLPLEPVLHGGGQERGVRSGTLDAAAAVGLAVAVHAAVTEQAALAERLAVLRDDLIGRVLAAVPGAVLNGPSAGRLPGNANVGFPGCDADALLMLLDARGVECSTGSACSAGVPEPSHVLVAMGAAPDVVTSSLRFSLGRTSTAAEVDALLAVLPGAVERARVAGRLNGAGADGRGR